MSTWISLCCGLAATEALSMTARNGARSKASKADAPGGGSFVPIPRMGGKRAYAEHVLEILGDVEFYTREDLRRDDPDADPDAEMGGCFETDRGVAVACRACGFEADISSGPGIPTLAHLLGDAAPAFELEGVDVGRLLRWAIRRELGPAVLGGRRALAGEKGS